MASKYIGPAGGFVPETNDPVLAPQRRGVLCPYCKKGDQVFASGMFGKKDLSCTRCKRTFIVVKKKKETEMNTKKTTNAAKSAVMRTVFTKHVAKVKKNLADARKTLAQDLKDLNEYKATVSEMIVLRSKVKMPLNRERFKEVIAEMRDDLDSCREDVEMSKTEVIGYENELKKLLAK